MPFLYYYGTKLIIYIHLCIPEKIICIQPIIRVENIEDGMVIEN